MVQLLDVRPEDSDRLIALMVDLYEYDHNQAAHRFYWRQGFRDRNSKFMSFIL